MSIPYLLRGAVAGTAVIAIMSAALEYAVSVVERHPTVDGPETLGATMLVMLWIGVPSSLVVGLLAAWAIGLPRPWLVSLVGLLNAGLFVCGLGRLLERHADYVPRWLLVGSLVILAYAVAALLVGRCRHHKPGISNQVAR